MRKVIVDFVAHRSVVVALNDDDDDDKAIEIAEDYINYRHNECPTWEFENSEDTENEVEANSGNIYTCDGCGKQYVDMDEDGICPYCGYER